MEKEATGLEGLNGTHHAEKIINLLQNVPRSWPHPSCSRLKIEVSLPPWRGKAHALREEERGFVVCFWSLGLGGEEVDFKRLRRGRHFAQKSGIPLLKRQKPSRHRAAIYPKIEPPCLKKEEVGGSAHSWRFVFRIRIEPTISTPARAASINPPRVAWASMGPWIAVVPERSTSCNW